MLSGSGVCGVGVATVTVTGSAVRSMYEMVGATGTWTLHSDGLSSHDISRGGVPVTSAMVGVVVMSLYSGWGRRLLTSVHSGYSLAYVVGGVGDLGSSSSSSSSELGGVSMAMSSYSASSASL